VTDLDQLFAAGNLVEGVATEVSHIKFDLSGDGMINGDDVSLWLSQTALANGYASRYLPGDTNLDGNVDAIDLNALAISWQQGNKVWSNGDVNGDGTVDSHDLNLLGINWQQSVPLAASQSVPEPSGGWLLLLAGLIGLVSRSRNVAAS
jgi:hypothetical protein